MYAPARPHIATWVQWTSSRARDTRFRYRDSPPTRASTSAYATMCCRDSRPGTTDALTTAGNRGSGVGLHRDLVFGLRMLRKNSLLLVVASLSLGLGIGLNTTVFSAVHAALFRAPAVERADD